MKFNKNEFGWKEKVNTNELPDDLSIGNSLTVGIRLGDIGIYSVAEGSNTEASGESSHAEGSNTEASGERSHAEGESSIASGNYAHAEGICTEASGKSSHAEGDSSIASGEASHAEGSGAEASGNYSHAENYAIAEGDNSHAEGFWTYASSANQHVQGKFNIKDTTGTYAHIVGNGTSNIARSNAHTLDWNGNAWYSGEVQGTNLPYKISETTKFEITVQELQNAWAECQAGTDSSMYLEVPTFDIDESNMFFIEYNGKRHRVDSIYQDSGSVARWNIEFYNAEDEANNIMGGYVGTHYDKDWNDSDTTALVKINRLDREQAPVFTDAMRLIEVSIHELDTLLLGKDVDIYNSISIKRKPNTKIGENSIAIGIYTEASGMGASATGSFTTASSHCSHAEGNSTTASGESSHAEGGSTEASGNLSHAEGSNTIASGNASHAEGYLTYASSANQHVQGKFNIKDTTGTYAHIVGNGTSKTKRSNAHTLDWQGNGWYKGKLSQDGTPTEDKDLATKKYVDDSIANQPQISFDTEGNLVVTIGGVTKKFKEITE